MLFSGIVTFIICGFIALSIDRVILPKYIFELTKIITIMLSCAVVYGGLNLALKMDYASELVNRIKNRK